MEQFFKVRMKYPRCVKPLLLCVFILYCHFMFEVYRILDKLTVDTSDDAPIYSNEVKAHQPTINSTHAAVRISVTNMIHTSYLWPRDLDDTSERIINQLEYAYSHGNMTKNHLAKDGNYEQMKMIYKDKLYRLHADGRTVFLNENCPINTCYVINEDSKEHNLSIYFDAYVMSGVYLLDSHIRLKPDAVRIWYHLESPLNAACPKRGINWTATYRRSSTITTPYEFFQPRKTVHFPHKTKTRNHADGKTKMAVILMSNCNAKNNRSYMVKALQQHITVDIYGECGPLKCPKIPMNISKECFRNMSRDYKFYLSFENSNCRDYITEKFFVNGLSNDVVPVVMGAHPDDYRAVAPPHSYIHVDDFESPRHLADYLKLLDKNDTLYNEYFKWKGTGSFINTKFWCRLCAMLHARDQTNYVHTYTSLAKWWRTDQCVMPEGPYGATWRNISARKP